MSPPHGGKLVQVVQHADLAKFSGYSENQKIRVEADVRTTVANIANGVYSPLQGFMGEDDYLNVTSQMRLGSDIPWTIPVLLLASHPPGLEPGDDVLLVGADEKPLAVLGFEGAFEFSKKEHAMKVFGTEDEKHPGVARVYAGPSTAVAGTLKAVAKPDFGKFADFTLAPRETRVLFAERGWKTVVAFQTRNAPHVNHEYLQKSALALVDGLFVNPVIGRKKQGDFSDDVILSAYQALIEHYFPRRSVVLSALHYEMQYAGPKEAVMHAIMRKNFGCTHIIIGRDHAGVGGYYGPFAAQQIFQEVPDIGITPMAFKEFYYCKKCAGIASEKTCPHGEEDRLTFSGTKLRQMFADGQTPPREFMRQEVVDIILRAKTPFLE